MEVHSQHSSQKYGIPKIDSLHSINSKLGIVTQLDTDGSVHKPKLDHLNQVSVSCGVVDMTQMINKTPQNEELFQPSITAHNNSVMHPAARDARSVSPALSPSVARRMKTYFSSLKTVIKRKPIIRKTQDQSPQKLQSKLPMPKLNQLNNDLLHSFRHGGGHVQQLDSDRVSLASQPHVNQREIIPEMPGFQTDRLPDSRGGGGGVGFDSALQKHQRVDTQHTNRHMKDMSVSNDSMSFDGGPSRSFVQRHITSHGRS